MRFLVEILLCLNLLALPACALAQAISPKDPLSYPLRVYGFMLAVAILGGFVSWYAKVRRNEIPAGSVFHLIGEVTTSAFAGMLAFFACEYANFPQILTAAVVGVSGHMGAKIISMAENMAKRRLDQPDAATSNSGAAQ